MNFIISAHWRPRHECRGGMRLSFQRRVDKLKYLKHNFFMKLTLQIKLLPTEEQSQSLLETMKQANHACNRISEFAFAQKIFNHFKLHQALYHDLKAEGILSAQMLVRCFGKVSQSYKASKKTLHGFKPFGAIAYDGRILSYKGTVASLWTTGGRLSIPFVCHNPKYLPYIKGEADLVTKKGKFYLFQTVEIPDTEIDDVEEFIGVDFGVNNIATLSDGTNHSSDSLNAVRENYQRIRSSVQSKGTRGSRKLLKRLGGRERRFATITNHTISKRIVEKAVSEGKGIAIEDLTYIRDTMIVRKGQRRKHHSWSFAQLRSFLSYKSLMAGIPLAVVDPRNTSRTCSACGHCDKKNRKSQSEFVCVQCGFSLNADINAARNIAKLGSLVNRPENRRVKVC